MEIARVFNNNLVLARDEAGREVILTGRGLGFQARPGQVVDETRVVRTFVPSDGRDPDHLAQLLSGIPPEHIQLVSDALSEVGLDAVGKNPALVIAVADHVSFALRRMAIGMDLEYPLLAEVRHLYADEYAQARALLGAINARSEIRLPDATSEPEKLRSGLRLAGGLYSMTTLPPGDTNWNVSPWATALLPTPQAAMSAVNPSTAISATPPRTCGPPNRARFDGCADLAIGACCEREWHGSASG